MWKACRPLLAIARRCWSSCKNTPVATYVITNKSCKKEWEVFDLISGSFEDWYVRVNTCRDTALSLHWVRLWALRAGKLLCQLLPTTLPHSSDGASEAGAVVDHSGGFGSLFSAVVRRKNSDVGRPTLDNSPVFFPNFPNSVPGRGLIDTLPTLGQPLRAWFLRRTS